jgi:hypothetical protein
VGQRLAAGPTGDGSVKPNGLSRVDRVLPPEENLGGSPVAELGPDTDGLPPGLAHSRSTQFFSAITDQRSQ